MKGEDEDRLAFQMKLPSTLETLHTMHKPPLDDTILHRLLDIVKRIITTAEEAQNCGLFTFLEKVAADIDSVNASVTVLALGMAAHLGVMMMLPLAQLQKVTLLYDAVQSNAALDHSSVAAAYYNSLALVVACPAGLKWVEGCPVPVKSALSTLETAQSIFLLKAAEDFVVATVRTSLQEHHGNSPSSVVTETGHWLCSSLTSIGRGRVTLLEHMLMTPQVQTFHQCLTQLTNRLTSDLEFCRWKAEDRTFVDAVAAVALQHTCGKFKAAALQSVVRLCECMEVHRKQDFLMAEILSPLLKLVTEGEVEKGIATAAAFNSPQQKVGANEVLECLYQMPYHVLFHGGPEKQILKDLVPMVTTAMADRQKFSRLMPSVLHFVKQEGHCSGLVQLLRSASAVVTDDLWSSHLGQWPAGVAENIRGNRKLLHSLLHLLQQDQGIALDEEHCIAILDVLLAVMRQPAIESRLFSQTCSAFLAVLGQQLKGQEKTSGALGVMTELCPLLQRCLVAVQWEVRDTTLEFIRKIIGLAPAPWFLHLMLENHMFRDAWLCGKDGESYPRASAIAMVTSLVKLPDWWAAFLQDAGETEASVVERMVEVLSEDTEAFPRRAAVDLLTVLYLRSPTPSDPAPWRPNIQAAMMSAMSDLDWEVKRKVLEFWEGVAASLLSENQPGIGGENGKGDDPPSVAGALRLGKHRRWDGDSGGYKGGDSGGYKDGDSGGYKGVLKHLLGLGFGAAVLAGADDYDPAVREKALQMLATRLHQVSPQDHSAAKSRKLHLSALDCESRTVSISTASDVMDSDTSDSAQRPAAGQDNPANTETGGLSACVEGFLHKARLMNPSCLLRQLRCGDEYDRRPASLLEDVVAAANAANAESEVTLMSEDEFEDADDMFVDCY